MIEYKFVFRRIDKCVFVSHPDDLYYLVSQLTGDDGLAVEASSWAELATIGEEYEHADFVIFVGDGEVI